MKARAKSTKLIILILGANLSIEVRGGLSQIRSKLNFSQTNFEPVFTTSARTAAADANHLGRGSGRNGSLWLDSRQVRPLNALTTTQVNHAKRSHL